MLEKEKFSQKKSDFENALTTAGLRSKFAISSILEFLFLSVAVCGESRGNQNVHRASGYAIC